MTIVEVASKTMMCFEGNLDISYKVRLDLVLMGYITDYKNELKLNQVSLS